MSELNAAATFSNNDRMRVFHLSGALVGSSTRADVVFIHGISGHPLQTWITKSNLPTVPNASQCEGWFKWLADDIPGMRFLSVGYPATIFSPFGFATALYDRATMMLRALMNEGVGERPTVFVVHSMGGIIVKRMLRAALESTDKSHTDFFNNTRGIVFLATPHTGSLYPSFARMLFPFWFLSQSLRELAANDASLRELNDWMSRRLYKQCVFAQFFETRRIGNLLPMIVGPGSAAPPYGDSLLENSGVDADHIGIAKLQRRGEDLYASVRNFIIRAAEDKPSAPEQYHSAPIAEMPRGKERAPILHRLYMETGSLVTQIVDFLNEGTTGLRCAIVTAPSGYGKSTLANHIRLKQGGAATWLDPSLSICSFGVSRDKLLIIDDLGQWRTLDGQKRAEMTRLVQSVDRAVVCTRSDSVAIELAAVLGNSPSAKIFPIPALKEEDAAKFLRKYCANPSVLAAFGTLEIENLCRFSSGVPGILVIAFDLMSNNPTKLKDILAASHEGDAMAFASAILKEWLPVLFGIDVETGRDALALLTSNVNIFGLEPKTIAKLLNKPESEVSSSLSSIITLGYLREALPGFDETLVPHAILRSALQAGALPSPDRSTVADWQTMLANLDSHDSHACLSSLTAKVWATSEAFSELLSKESIPKSDIKSFSDLSRELSSFLLHQFVDVTLIQEALQNAVRKEAISDCTVAVSVSRAMRGITPPNAALGEAIWTLTQHPDGMARCEAVVAASMHWRGYPQGQRLRCIGLLQEFLTQSLEDKSMTAAGYRAGSALSGMVLLNDEESAFRAIVTQEKWDPTDRAVALSILALSMIATHSLQSLPVWRELLSRSPVDDCDAVARLYLCRSPELSVLRTALNLTPGQIQQMGAPIRIGSVQRLYFCGHYACHEKFVSFVDKGIECRWIIEQR
jgi:pimeloyl-ACP methyl ester carboxylesterase